MDVLKSGKESAARRNYRMQLCAERLTNRMTDHYVSMEMQRGIDLESTALEMYQIATQSMVIPVGFVLHPEWDFAGASPDGLVDSDGLIEVKAPKSETLIDWRLNGIIPEEYMLQMQWQMACTGRKWCDFYGYDDRLPPPISNLIKRVERDEKKIEEISAAVLQLNSEIEAMIQQLGLPPTRWTPYHELLKETEQPEVGYDPTKSFEEQVDFLDSREMVP
jgi:putative phage-type endonuclease